MQKEIKLSVDSTTPDLTPWAYQKKIGIAVIAIGILVSLLPMIDDPVLKIFCLLFGSVFGGLFVYHATLSVLAQEVVDRGDHVFIRLFDGRTFELKINQFKDLNFNSKEYQYPFSTKRTKHNFGCFETKHKFIPGKRVIWFQAPGIKMTKLEKFISGGRGRQPGEIERETDDFKSLRLRIKKARSD
jgi:hypothetical protein